MIFNALGKAGVELSDCGGYLVNPASNGRGTTWEAWQIFKSDDPNIRIGRYLVDAAAARQHCEQHQRDQIKIHATR